MLIDIIGLSDLTISAERRHKTQLIVFPITAPILIVIVFTVMCRQKMQKDGLRKMLKNLYFFVILNGVREQKIEI